jgi:hypothetical protein
MAKKNETQYLDWLDGWGYERRDRIAIAKAVYYQVKDRAWSEWSISSLLNSSEDRKYRHALHIHGKDPDNAIRPPLQIPWVQDADQAVIAENGV